MPKVNKSKTNGKNGNSLPVVLYPEPRTLECWRGTKLGPINQDTMKEMLKWQSESQYVEEQLLDPSKAEKLAKEKKKNPDVKAADVLGFGEEYLFIDENGEKVNCWSNQHNRWLRIEDARKYAQDVLERQWAGPTTLQTTSEYVYGGDKPFKMSDGTTLNKGDKVTLCDGTINGETFTLDRLGNIVSGQHRGIGYIFACQMWKKDPAKWSTLWPEEPVFESLVFVGVSNHPRILRTVDNVIPRNLADVLFTSPMFDDVKGRVDRHECSKMTDSAVDFLWKRTKAGGLDWGKEKGTAKVHQTHAESMDFIDRHGGAKGHLLQAVRHLFACNNVGEGTAIDAPISKLRLRPVGTMASLCYLMGSSSTEPKKYYEASTEPSEKLLNWKNWTTSKDFWKTLSEIGEGDDDSLAPLIQALKAIAEEGDDGISVSAKRLIVLSRAWSKFLDGKKFTAEDISLTKADYSKKDDGTLVLEARSNFGGIDCGSAQRSEAAVGEADVEEKKSTTRRKRERKDMEKTNGNGVTPRAPGEVASPDPIEFDEDGKPRPRGLVKTLTAQLEELHAANPGKFLLFKDNSGTHRAYLDDAVTLERVCGFETKAGKHIQIVAEVPADRLAEAVLKLRQAKVKVAIVEPGDDGKGFKVSEASKPETKAGKMTSASTTKTPTAKQLQAEQTRKAVEADAAKEAALVVDDDELATDDMDDQENE